MKHFLNPVTQDIYAYEADGSQDSIIPKDYIPLTDAEVAAHREQRRQAHLATITYDQWRRSSYPPMEDYLDAIVKGDQALIQKYIDACLAVKAKYPKP
jgi:hypothetical protein